MGTRNLVCVVVNGEMKVAQYGQWDGYLEGQGKTVIEFIAKQMRLADFKEAVSECRWMKPAEVRKSYVEAGDSPNNTSGMINMEVADKHSDLYPGLSRDRGAEILTLIQDGTYTKNVKENGEYKQKTITVKPVRKLVDSRSFARDSLFCEWAYVLDLDAKVLEIYQGFNHEKPTGRFASLKPTAGRSGFGKDKGKKYQTITLWQTLTFAQCKKKDALNKLKALYKKEQQAEERAEKAHELLKAAKA